MSSARPRTDPFGLGIEAYVTGLARSACPFRPDFVEGRTWLEGWDFRKARPAAWRLGETRR